MIDYETVMVVSSVCSNVEKGGDHVLVFRWRDVEVCTRYDSCPLVHCQEAANTLLFQAGYGVGLGKGGKLWQALRC